MVRKVIALKILDQPWFWDHCLLALTLSCDFKLKNQIHTDNDITPIKNFLWTSESDVKFLQSLQSLEIQKKLHQFNNKKLENTEEATKEITNIIISTAEKSLKSKLSNVVKSNTKKYILYDSNCQILRGNLEKTGVLFFRILIHIIKEWSFT